MTAPATQQPGAEAQAPYALAHALAYARLGFPVFPIGTNKRPLPGSHGFKDATTDEATIRAWFAKHSNAGVALYPGPASVLVLDVDVKSGAGGQEAMEALEAHHGSLPATLRQRSPSGGYHLFFVVPKGFEAGNAHDLGKGIDVRCSAGYIGAEPSRAVYPDGSQGEYSFLDWDVLSGEVPEIEAAPEWLIHRLTAARSKDRHAELVDQVTGEVRPVAGSSKERLQTIQTGGPGLHDALRDEACAWVRSGMRGDHVTNRLRDLMDVSTGPHNERWQERHKEIPRLVSSAEAMLAPAVSELGLLAGQVASNEPRFKLLTADDLRALPPLAWRVSGVLPATGLAAVYGPSGSGKSFLTIDMAAAIAEGREWFGHRVKAAPVVYAALEGEAGIRGRVLAWELANERALPDGLRPMLQPFRITSADDVVGLAEQVNALGPGAVVVIDTLNRAAPEADENASKDMGQILEGAKALQRLTGGLVLLVHHTGKNAEAGMRGHSSLIAALDASIEVRREGEQRTWRVAKAKDGEDGAVNAFSLEVVEIETDEFGEPTTSCVVLPCESDSSGGPRITDRLAAGVRLLNDLACVHSDFDGKGGVVGVDKEVWREAFNAATESDSDQARDRAFQRLRKDLRDANLITVAEGRYLPTGIDLLTVRAAIKQRGPIIPTAATVTRH